MHIHTCLQEVCMRSLIKYASFGSVKQCITRNKVDAVFENANQAVWDPRHKRNVSDVCLDVPMTTTWPLLTRE